MSYSAFVVCNCYQKGKTVEPPHKEYIKFDEDGLFLDIPNDLWDKNEKKVLQMDSDFDNWKNSACEHEEMELCYEYLSNTLGMVEFKGVIERLGGKEKFPILSKFLPTANGGTLPAKFTPEVLKEIDEFEKQKLNENRILLFEVSTNELKATVNAETYLIFVLTAYNKNNYGIDKDGFFILENVKENDQEVSYVVFRSKNFIQKYISIDKFMFIDKKTNNSFICNVGLHPHESNPKKEYEFLIKENTVKIVDEYKYMTEPLKKLAEASMESGNPIHWC
ncbi:hypothetical protein ACFS5M_07070 [Lacinutrix iliipiscaria]|uniref:Uncharacterized protein n=1 Tax=Lacinutrix iliipiscaria TaxID=1230532 RepID=A0ABW5WME8_9FLAO